VLHNLCFVSLDMDRADKLRKLESFRRKLPFASASAIASILQEVKNEGLPELYSRDNLREAASLQVDHVTPYGKLTLKHEVVTKTGDKIQISVINPVAMIFRAFEQGGGFTNLMCRKMDEFRPTLHSPWGLIFYTDEVTPGNALGFDNRRKVWALYISFKQFGPILLSNENCWLCVGCVRSTTVSGLSAGISQVISKQVMTFFGSLGHDFSKAGILLKHPSGSIHKLFCEVSMFLQDGAAHKMLFHCKGDAGTRMCMLCANLLAAKSKIMQPSEEEDDHDGIGSGLVTTILDEDQLHFATDSDVRRTVGRLCAAKEEMSAKHFALFEQACGFNHEPQSILNEPGLADHVFPVTQYCHDWMHALLVNGCFNTVFFLWLNAVSNSLDDVYKLLYNYSEMWVFPAATAGFKVHQLFQQKRSKSNNAAKSFKCSASEALTVYHIVAMFIQTVVLKASACVNECKAVLALADLLDILQMIPLQLEKITPEVLRTAVKTFLTSCTKAGWQDFLHPKFHWCIHFPQHFSNHGFLPTCFVHERKHKLVKRYLGCIQNTTNFEDFILRQMCSHELHHLQKEDLFLQVARLQNPRKPSKSTMAMIIKMFGESTDPSSCFTSSCANLDPAGTCSNNDIVLIKPRTSASMFEAAEVLFHVSVYDICFSAVLLLTAESYDKVTGIAAYRKPANSEKFLIKTNDIICTAVCWSKISDELVRVLLPLRCRV